MRQKLRKYIKDFEEDMTKFREAEINLSGDDDEEEIDDVDEDFQETDEPDDLNNDLDGAQEQIDVLPARRGRRRKVHKNRFFRVERRGSIGPLFSNKNGDQKEKNLHKQAVNYVSG